MFKSCPNQFHFWLLFVWVDFFRNQFSEFSQINMNSIMFLLGIFRVALLFICQSSFRCCLLRFLSSNSVILSQVLCFVNNFFKVFSTFFKVALSYLAFASATNLSISLCFEVVNTYFTFFSFF